MTPAIQHHAPAADRIDLDRFMAALAAVETGSTPAHMKWSAVGKRAELGPWQITRAAWQETFPYFAFSYAADEEVGAFVVRRRLYDLVKAGCNTPTKLAHAWNPRAPADYADRVVNLYNDSK